MSDNYTLPTGVVEDAACFPRDILVSPRPTLSHSDFGRWLASIKAEAWGEAVEVLDQLHGDLPGLDHIVQDLGDINPYRKEQTDESP